jgi:hypothetical protein
MSMIKKQFIRMSNTGLGLLLCAIHAFFSAFPGRCTSFITGEKVKGSGEAMSYGFGRWLAHLSRQEGAKQP